jgi:hypothetical protein
MLSVAFALTSEAEAEEVRVAAYAASDDVGRIVLDDIVLMFEVTELAIKSSTLLLGRYCAIGKPARARNAK